MHIRIHAHTHNELEKRAATCIMHIMIRNEDIHGMNSLAAQKCQEILLKDELQDVSCQL